MTTPAPEERRSDLFQIEKARLVLEKARRAFETLSKRSDPGTSESFYSVAEIPLQVFYREKGFETVLLPSLKHLNVTQSSQDPFTLYLAGPEILEKSWLEGLRLGDKPSSLTEGFFCEDASGAAILFLSGSFASISCVDFESRRALYGVTGFDAVPPFEIAAPFRSILYWMSRQSGRQALHAACIGYEKGSVLVAGRGGSGKTGTSLSCLEAGLGFAGDDYTIVDASGEVPQAYSVYASTKLFPKDLQARENLKTFFSFQTPSSEFPDEKCVGVMNSEGLKRTLIQSSVKALLIPEICHVEYSEIVPVNRISVLKELAPSTLFQFPGAGQPDLERMAALVRKIPCMRLKLGSDKVQTANLIKRICLEGC